MAANPDSHSQISRIGGLTSWANTVDRKARMAPAIAANPSQIDYWVRKTRENPAFAEASEDQILAAATSAQKAHYIRMARESAKSRAAKAAVRRGGDAA